MKILWTLSLLATGTFQPSPAFFPIGEDDAVTVPMDAAPIPGVEYRTDVLGRQTYLSQACLEEQDQVRSSDCYRREISSHQQMFRAPNIAAKTSKPKPSVSSHSHRKPEFVPIEGRHYVNVDGNSIRSPIRANSRPAGATARCRDGSWSFSQHHRGTCSHHGGVASW